MDGETTHNFGHGIFHTPREFTTISFLSYRHISKWIYLTLSQMPPTEVMPSTILWDSLSAEIPSDVALCEQFVLNSSEVLASVLRHVERVVMVKHCITVQCACLKELFCKHRKGFSTFHNLKKPHSVYCPYLKTYGNGHIVWTWRQLSWGLIQALLKRTGVFPLFFSLNQIFNQTFISSTAVASVWLPWYSLDIIINSARDIN